MRKLKFFLLLIVLGSIINCEHNKDLVNRTTDAVVVNFVTEKCYCCWGWVIEVGSETIKADSIPGLNNLQNVVFPFPVKITIGNKTRNCSELLRPDYYEIEQCILINKSKNKITTAKNELAVKKILHKKN